MSNITAVTPFALTAKGHALQLKVQAGLCKLELVGAKIGDGYLQEGQTIESLTSLEHEIPTADGSAATESPIATLAEVYKDTDTRGRERVMVHVYVKNGNNESTRIRECAILAKDTDNSVIIYGYINLGDSSMPFDQYNGTTPIVYNWKFPLYISNEANINMDFGFVAGVSREDFDAFVESVTGQLEDLEEHVHDKDNPHEVTASDVGAFPENPSNTDLNKIFDDKSFIAKEEIRLGDIGIIDFVIANNLSFYRGTTDNWSDNKHFVDGYITTTWGNAVYGAHHGTFSAVAGQSFQLFVRLYEENGVLKYDEYYGGTEIPEDAIYACTIVFAQDGADTKATATGYLEWADDAYTLREVITVLAREVRQLQAANQS